MGMSKEEACLITRILVGEAEAFGELVKKYQGIVFGLAFHFVKNYADAEDLAQEAFLKAYQQLGQLKDRRKFSSWLRQITANLCRNFIQRKNDLLDHSELVDTTPEGQQVGDLADVMDATPTPDRVAEAHQLHQLVHHAIEKLSEPHRLTVTLFYMDGLSVKEVANFLDVSPSTVKSRLHYARKQLKERMMTMVEDVFQQTKPGAEFTERVMALLQEKGVTAEEVWLVLWLHYRLPDGTTETYPMRISGETMESLFNKSPEIGESILVNLGEHLNGERGKFAKIAKSLKKTIGKAIEKAAKQAFLKEFQKHGIDVKAEDIKVGDYPCEI